MRARDVPAHLQQFSYFQFRRLPLASHRIVVATRFCRVSGRFASVIHSMYSRRGLGLKSLNTFAAFAFFFNAAERSAGMGRGFLGFGRAGAPDSFNFAACRM